MNHKHYRSSNSELPTRNGTYDCQFYFGTVEARWLDGKWYFRNWDRVPENLEVKWR